jgi:hypothetical protein
MNKKKLYHISSYGLEVKCVVITTRGSDRQTDIAASDYANYSLKAYIADW